MLVTERNITSNEPENDYAQNISIEHRKSSHNSLLRSLLHSSCQNGFWETKNSKRF